MKIEIEDDNEMLTTIDNHLLVTFLIQSFRYCLGRRTYAVSECVEVLHLYWHKLPYFLQKQIHDDIKESIESNYAGDECDKQTWTRLLKLELKPSI